MANVGVRKTGDWAKARKLLRDAAARLQHAQKVALLQEAQVLRNDIVRGLTAQGAGGASFAPLSPLTLAARRLKGLGGTKALIARADLRNAIAALSRGDEVFVGVPRKAKGPGGGALVDVAQIQEYGAGPTAIPLTPKMQRFLFVLLREAGVAPSAGSGAGTGYVLVRVPARPFLQPPFDAFSKVAPERYARRVAGLMGWGG